MKKVSLMVLFIVMMSFQSKAQEVSSVTITGYNTSNFIIEIVKPDYEVVVKEFKRKGENFHALMKRELDVWLKQGYKLVEATANSATPGQSPVASFVVLFVLIKEQ